MQNMQAQSPDQTRVDAFVRTADRDLQVAELIEQHSPQFHENIGFHCQQAVEKYVKAALVVYGRPVPYTHDLNRLVADLTPFINFDQTEQAAATVLIGFAVDWRYELDDAPGYTSAELLAMAYRFRDKLRPLALAFLV